jgi:hypothetical protein
VYQHCVWSVALVSGVGKFARVHCRSRHSVSTAPSDAGRDSSFHDMDIYGAKTIPWVPHSSETISPIRLSAGDAVQVPSAHP